MMIILRKYLKKNTFEFSFEGRWFENINNTPQ